MKFRILFITGLLMLGSSPWIISVQSHPATKLAGLAPPADVRVEAGANAIKISWTASPDEGGNEFAGYNIYFDTKSLVDLSVDSLLYTVELGKNIREYVIRGLENSRSYFLHIRSRKIDGSIGMSSVPENTLMPQTGGKHYAIAIFDNSAVGTPGICNYGWNNENGQGIPGYHNLTQNGENINIVLMESSLSKTQSVFISPSETNLTEGWSSRNKTLIADIGTSWIVNSVLIDSSFTTRAVVKEGHVYVLRFHDIYHVKLRIDSIDEVKLLLPARAQQRDLEVNKITFTYASQLGQSYEQFLRGKP